MEAQHFLGKVSLRALIEREGKIFLCRGIGDTVWQLPGGRMHVGEEPQDGLIREIKEEFGVAPKVDQLFYTQTFEHFKDKVAQLLLVYLCSIGEQSIKINPAENEEYKWVPREELKILPMFEDCRRAVDEFLKLR